MARSCIRHDSPHQKDRRDANQRGDADGARRRAVVARPLGHDVYLERALVPFVVDECRDGNCRLVARGVCIAIGNVNCRRRRAIRLLVDDWPCDPRQTGAGDLHSSIARKGPVALGRDVAYEDEITELLLSGGLDDAGRAAFCSGTRKDCQGDAVEEAAKRQGIADILSGINDDPPAAPAKRRRKRKKKPVAAEL